MLLGDLIARFTDEAVAGESILKIGDLVLLAALRERANKEEPNLGVFVASAVRLYATETSDEEWTTLIGAMGQNEDPGAICLKRSFAHILRDAHFSYQRVDRK